MTDNSINNVFNQVTRDNLFDILPGYMWHITDRLKGSRRGRANDSWEVRGRLNS